MLLQDAHSPYCGKYSAVERAIQFGVRRSKGWDMGLGLDQILAGIDRRHHLVVSAFLLSNISHFSVSHPDFQHFSVNTLVL
ncbi:hypothetical protein [Iningainema tapete]|uniref:Uncharacterized protein n=1 Tax=Iningainema tapete BLCC-T55 TaxID=2748662 RepID=A0A8J7BWD1_9CYAN|nr:hypothetical protein [Iningainema tapete]MBD2770703.1 hypothetical protein [Iningainema tapete BLCC-T55]